MKNKIAVIIGAGPAGLTAALELLEKTDIKPVIYEETGDIGGISKTVNYKGNRIDIGGHRFFSKSQRVMDWWESILPLQGKPAADYKILGEEIPLSNKEGAPDPEKTDRVMLIRKRLSRIFYLGKFFDYPVTLNMNTIRNLGPARIARIGFSYLHARIFPVHEEKSLEDFFINRFGRELYMTFFKDYTEKVWGYPCDKIDSSWGSQRVKGLSLIKTVVHAFGSILFNNNPQSAKGLETSLIGQFHYPKFGPGQLWQEAASRVIEKGGKIHFHRKAVLIRRENSSIKSVEFQNMNTNKRMIAGGDYFLSTMPVRDLIRAMTPEVPEKISSIAGGLAYRDFITAGILVDKLMIRNDTKIRTINDIIPDNWIYIQESGVKVGRLQIFNNWSPYMVNDTRNVWIGMEYFCDQGDDLWRKEDEELKKFAVGELEKIGIINRADVRDSVIIRVPKTYPSYIGTYDQFSIIREYIDSFTNLFLIGRNGMHRYNNMDHSMMTAMTAVENIAGGVTSKDNIWAVNTEEKYHEGK